MSQKKNILVVEDDPELRKLMRKHLESAGHVVNEVGTGRAAITHCETNLPDLICLDLMLPELSGYQVCEALRKNPATSRVRILVVSARTMPEDRAFAEDAGADAHLGKPFSRADFLQRVQTLLASERR